MDDRVVVTIDGTRHALRPEAAHCLHEELADALIRRRAFVHTAGERPGVTGSRRHLLVRHLAEHPAFDCRLVSENPLVAEKGSGDGEKRE